VLLFISVSAFKSRVIGKIFGHRKEEVTASLEKLRKILMICTITQYG